MDPDQLNQQTLAIARALQDYGGYIVDRAGDGTVALYAEPGVPDGWTASVTGPTWTGGQLTTIRQQLRVVANNSPSADRRRRDPAHADGPGGGLTARTVGRPGRRRR